MKSNVKIISECKREIELEIEAKEVIENLEKIVAQFSSRAKIPGFRPGKAPKDLVKRMFFPEIKESLINYLAPKALNNELKAQNIHPVGMPVINELYFKEGQPLRLKAQCEILPEFTLPEYKKIRVKNRNISVSNQEINQYLEELRSRSAEYVPIEGRGVVDGDYVVAELKGKDTKTKKFFPTEKVVILAGHPDNEKILNQNLIGLKLGEENNLILTYDKNHQNRKLAGKKVDYKLKVLSIKEKRLHDINDEFAKNLGEYESLKDLKKEIKSNIKASKEKSVKKEMAEEIIKKISDNVSIELPDMIVEQEYISILKDLLSSRPQKDIKEEDVEKLKAEAKKKAEQNLRNHLILKKIAKNEGLDVTDEEIEEELKAIAKANQVPLAKVVESINKEGKRDDLKSSILLKKTVDFLVEHAIIE